MKRKTTRGEHDLWAKEEPRIKQLPLLQLEEVQEGAVAVAMLLRATSHFCSMDKTDELIFLP